MKFLTLFFYAFIGSFALKAQIVNIPDANFKNYLVNDFSVNTNNDSEIQTTEANAFTGTLFLDSKNINDLTGIESFLNVTSILCSNNNITTLDVSNSQKLTDLFCGGNPLTSLNVSGCSSLKILNTNLSPLTSVNLLNNDSLTSLSMRFNNLSSLDLSGNPNLIGLNVSNNQITTLNIANNIKIQSFVITKNLVSSLNLSNHSDLDILFVDSNNLTTLNIQNDSNIALPYFKSKGNPNLSCIQVDDVAWSTANWTSIDATSSFNTNCSTDINEEILSSENFIITPNPAKNHFNIKVPSGVLTLRLLDISGKTILTKKLQNGNNIINVNTLNAGFYNLIIHNPTKIVTTQKLIIGQ